MTATFPGTPWRAIGNTVRDADGRLVGEIIGPHGHVLAQLLAAAPDLVGAVKALVALSQVGPRDLGDALGGGALLLVEQALSKVNGETRGDA